MKIDFSIEKLSKIKLIQYRLVMFPLILFSKQSVKWI